MSAAVAVAQVLGADIPAGDLDGLCRAVWRRVGREVQMHGQEQPWVWPILEERKRKVLLGQTMVGGYVSTRAQHEALMAQFETDVRGLLALPAERFAYCVRANATSPAGFSHDFELQRQREDQALHQAPALPRVQPRELLARLAGAGVIVQAIDGNLHVQPAELLSEADRAALTGNKAAILEALAMPAAVI